MRPETKFLLSFAAIHEAAHSTVQDLIEVFAAITTPVGTTGSLYHYMYGAWASHKTPFACGQKHKRAFMERARTHRECVITKRPPPEPYNYEPRGRVPKRQQQLDPVLQTMIEGTEFFQSARAIGRLTRLRLVTQYELQIPLVRIATATMTEYTRVQIHNILGEIFTNRHPRSFYRWTEPVPGIDLLLRQLRL